MMKNYYETIIKIKQNHPELGNIIPSTVLRITVNRRSTGGKEIRFIGLHDGRELMVTTPLTEDLKELLGL